MVSVIIAQRNEPYLRQTVASIVKACGGTRPEVLVVNDGRQEKRPDVPAWVRVETPWERPRGCQAARDWGLLNATHQACVVVDGHMDFDPGLFDGYRKHLADNPHDVLCAHCPGLVPQEWRRQVHDCSGAFFLWQDGGTCLSLKWRYSYDTGEVPAVLGACYGINREWYLDGLQRPWQYGTGWGADEEILSISNWLCGGRNFVMPYDAAHWFRDQASVPYPTDAFAVCGSYANRIRMVKMLPMPDDWREGLLKTLYGQGQVKVLKRQIDAMLGESDPEEYRAWLSMQARTFTDWRRLWCSDTNPQGHPELNPPGISVTPIERNRATTPPPARRPAPCMPDPNGTVAVRPIAAAAPQRKAPEPNKVVIDPGVRCPHCHALYDHHITHTYPNGNRRRLCSACGRPFITMRKDDTP